MNSLIIIKSDDDGVKFKHAISISKRPEHDKKSKDCTSPSVKLLVNKIEIIEDYSVEGVKNDNIGKNYNMQMWRNPVNIHKINAIKDNVIEIINKDPNYAYMKTSVEKSMKLYNFANLVLAIGTLNPINIIHGLYKVGKDIIDDDIK